QLQSSLLCAKVLDNLKTWEHAKLFQFPTEPDLYQFGVKISNKHCLAISFDTAPKVYAEASMKDISNKKPTNCFGYEKVRQFKNIDEIKEELLRLHNLCNCNQTK